VQPPTVTVWIAVLGGHWQHAEARGSVQELLGWTVEMQLAGGHDGECPPGCQEAPCVSVARGPPTCL